jgi:hypothetical protein
MPGASGTGRSGANDSSQVESGPVQATIARLLATP